MVLLKLHAPLLALTLAQKIYKIIDILSLNGRIVALMVELVDTLASGASEPRSWEFKSPSGHKP